MIRYGLLSSRLLVVVLLLSSWLVFERRCDSFFSPSPLRATVRVGAVSSSLAAASSSSSSDGEPTPKHIVVVGGGFGGLNAALNLASNTEDDEDVVVRLVDKKERFVFLPLLYELCVGDADVEEVAPTFRSLLRGTKIEFTRGELQGVDVATDTVYYHDSADDDGAPARALSYDALVLATGMECDLRTIPGVADRALPFYTVEHCYELRRRLTLLDSYRAAALITTPSLQVVIVGGGYSGVELALNLMERLGGKRQVQVTLVHRGSTILEGASDFNRDTSLARLQEAGVEILLNTKVDDIVETDDRHPQKYDCVVHTSSKLDHNEQQTITTNLLLWTAGATPPPNTGALNSVLPRDRNNRIVTDDTLRVQKTPRYDHDNVFCIGDAARGRKEPHAANAQVAIQQAAVVGWNVLDVLRNRAPRDDLLTFRYLDLGTMMTLGSNDATMTSLGGAVTLNGPVASVARRLVYAVRMPTPSQAAKAAVLSTSRRVSNNLQRKRKNASS